MRGKKFNLLKSLEMEADVKNGIKQTQMLTFVAINNDHASEMLIGINPLIGAYSAVCWMPKAGGSVVLDEENASFRVKKVWI